MNRVPIVRGRRHVNWGRRLGKLILRKTRRSACRRTSSATVGIILIWSPHFVTATATTPLALNILFGRRGCQCSRGSINSLGWRQIIWCLLFEMPKVHMGIQISFWQICPSATIGTIPRNEWNKGRVYSKFGFCKLSREYIIMGWRQIVKKKVFLQFFLSFLPKFDDYSKWICSAVELFLKPSTMELKIKRNLVQSCLQPTISGGPVSPKFFDLWVLF